MRSFFPAVLAAGIALLALAQDAQAGKLTEMSGPVTVNGQAAAGPVDLKKGDVVATGSNGTAVITSDAGDRITLEGGTRARHEGMDGIGIEYVFVLEGSAVGEVSDKTRFGVATAWVTNVKGTKATVRAEAPGERRAMEGRFRAVRGDTWLLNGPTAVWVPANHSVTLYRSTERPGAICFRTGQQNPGRIVGERLVSGGIVRIEVPRATSGCIEDLPGNKTKISNEITSNKQEKIQVSTEFGTASTASIGPGTYALIDNQSGKIEVLDEIFDQSLGEEIPDVAGGGDFPSIQRTKKR